jgi:hypothetical protein
MIFNPAQGICHPSVGIDICLFAPWELANKKFFHHTQRQWSYLILNGIIIQMDSTIFKEGILYGEVGLRHSAMPFQWLPWLYLLSFLP